MYSALKQALIILGLALSTSTAVAESPIGGQTGPTDDCSIVPVGKTFALTSVGTLGAEIGYGIAPSYITFERFTPINRSDECFGDVAFKRMQEACVNLLSSGEPTNNIAPVEPEAPAAVDTCQSEQSSVAKLAKRNKQLRRQIRQMKRR